MTAWAPSSNGSPASSARRHVALVDALPACRGPVSTMSEVSILVAYLTVLTDVQLRICEAPERDHLAARIVAELDARGWTSPAAAGW